MQLEELSGYQICHLSKNMESVLREKRVVLGLTQQNVADKAKIKLQQYQKFESGERSIMTCSFQIACRVIEALEMDISKFYHGDYALGEEITFAKDGLRYVKTGKLINEDAERSER